MEIWQRMILAGRLAIITAVLSIPAALLQWNATSIDQNGGLAWITFGVATVCSLMSLCVLRGMREFFTEYVHSEQAVTTITILLWMSVALLLLSAYLKLASMGVHLGDMSGRALFEDTGEPPSAFDLLLMLGEWFFTIVVLVLFGGNLSTVIGVVLSFVVGVLNIRLALVIKKSDDHLFERKELLFLLTFAGGVCMITHGMVTSGSATHVLAAFSMACYVGCSYLWAKAFFAASKCEPGPPPVASN